MRDPGGGRLPRGVGRGGLPGGDRRPDLATYEQVLLDEILAVGPVRDARSTFAIRTVRSRGPLPLDHWPPRRG